MKRKTEKIELRLLSRSDASQLVSVFNEKLFKDYEMGPYPFKISDAKKYIIKAIKLKKEKKSFVYGVFLNNYKMIIGVGSIHSIDAIHKSGEIFGWIKEDFRNKDFGLELLTKLLHLGFNKYKLHRIESKLRADNIASKKTLEKLNFMLEGRLRKKYLNNGKYYDALEYSLLDYEYKT